MAINISLTGLTNTDGETLSGAHIRIRKFEETDETTIRINLQMWRTETDFLADRRDIWIEEIPQNFRNIVDSLTPSQYANVDNEGIQRKIADMIEQGTGHSKVVQLFPRMTWAGLGSGTTTIVMPS